MLETPPPDMCIKCLFQYLYEVPRATVRYLVAPAGVEAAQAASALEPNEPFVRHLVAPVDAQVQHLRQHFSDSLCRQQLVSQSQIHTIASSGHAVHQGLLAIWKVFTRGW